MSFKIVKNPKAWWPVTFPGVTEDGDVVENSFDMRFRILDQDEHFAIEREMNDFSATADLDAFVPSEVSATLILRLAEDWRGVAMDDGSDAGTSLPFSSENVATLMKVPNAFSSTLAAYRACRDAAPKARQGN